MVQAGLDRSRPARGGHQCGPEHARDVLLVSRYPNGIECQDALVIDAFDVAC